MTILNVDDIKEFKEQPIEYNTEKELIDWLKWDLLQQIYDINTMSMKKIKKTKDNLINVEKIQNTLVLNIGRELSNNNFSKTTIINFEFNICNIFYELFNEYNIIKIRINCTNLLFNHDVFLSTCIFKQDVNFYFCKFNHNIYFLGSTFEKSVNFQSSIFYKEISFSELSFNYAIFDYAIFYKEISFSELSFNYINLDSVTFFNDVVFSELIFNAIYLKNTEHFFTGLYFNDIKFKDLNSKLYIDLSNINITNINITNINITNINITNSIINGEIELRNIEAEEADFKGSVINGGLINPVNFKVHKFSNRESALFLKQQAYARNNVIDALQYKAKEIEKHKEDLIKDWQKNKDLKTFGDILSIELSSIYSDIGQNWIRALAMTIFITAFCFTVFYMPDVFYIDKIFNRENYISLYFCSYQNWFSELVKYFIPTDYTLLIKYAASNLNLLLKIFGVLVYFLGKVLFWYGSVQTVTAFRKFAKGA